MLVRRSASALLAGGVIAGSVLLGAPPALAAHEGDIFAVDINNVLFRLPSTANGSGNIVPTQSAPISGLSTGEVVIGIDFRPADGEIYAVTSKNRVYRVEYRPSGFGTATLISTLTDGSGNPVNISAAKPDGQTPTNFGYDFNPTVDRLRLVSDLGDNYRINVDTGVVIVDGSLKYAAGDVNANKAPHVTASAYTNPDNNAATGTELFDIDPGQIRSDDIVAKQAPPNDGVLTTRGFSGINSGNLVGYDIDTTNIGYASLITGDGVELITVTFDNDPNTADAPVVTPVGFVRTGELRDITTAIPDPDGAPVVAPPPVVPEFPLAALAPVLGLGLAGAMVVFRRRSAQQ